MKACGSFGLPSFSQWYVCPLPRARRGFIQGCPRFPSVPSGASSSSREEMQYCGFVVVSTQAKVHCRVFEENSGLLEVDNNNPRFRPRPKHINQSFHFFREFIGSLLSVLPIDTNALRPTFLPNRSRWTSSSTIVHSFKAGDIRARCKRECKVLPSVCLLLVPLAPSHFLFHNFPLHMNLHVISA